MVAVFIPPAISHPAMSKDSVENLSRRGEVIVERPTKPLALPHRAALAADLLDGYHAPIPETLEFPLP